MKNFLLIIALLLFLQLIVADTNKPEFNRLLPDSLQATNIVDSVYSDSVLDGEISYSQNAQNYEINNWMYDMNIGDSGTAIVYPDPNSHYRSYISFDLPEISDEYIIDSVYVRLYQYYSIGNGDPSEFPIWDIANGDTIKCILSHIDYGDELDTGDWDKGDPGNPFTFNHKVGVVTDSPVEGYRYIDATDCVIADYDAGRSRSQYRLTFENITTDWDGESDLVSFMTSSAHEYNHLKPTLIIAASLDLSSYETEIVNPEVIISNYPNPFNPSTNISYDLKHHGNVNLKIYNLKGQIIETIVDNYQSKGYHTVSWNADKYPSGVYLYRLSSGNQSQTGKCLLLK